MVFFKTTSKIEHPFSKKTVKIAVWGPNSSGKTSLIDRLRGKTFQKTYEKTIGSQFHQYQENDTKYQYWDISLPPNNKESHIFLINTDVVLLCFPVAEPAQFANSNTNKTTDPSDSTEHNHYLAQQKAALARWLNYLATLRNSDHGSTKALSIIVVGTKTDLRGKKGYISISENEFTKIVQQQKDRFDQPEVSGSTTIQQHKECSAQTNLGIKTLKNNLQSSSEQRSNTLLRQSR